MTAAITASAVSARPTYAIVALAGYGLRVAGLAGVGMAAWWFAFSPDTAARSSIRMAEREWEFVTVLERADVGVQNFTRRTNKIVGRGPTTELAYTPPPLPASFDRDADTLARLRTQHVAAGVGGAIAVVVGSLILMARDAARRPGATA